MASVESCLEAMRHYRKARAAMRECQSRCDAHEKQREMLAVEFSAAHKNFVDLEKAALSEMRDLVEQEEDQPLPPHVT